MHDSCVTIIAFTLITLVIHQNLASATLAFFIQPRAVVCVSYAQAAFECSEPLFCSVCISHSAMRNGSSCSETQNNITEHIQERWCCYFLLFLISLKVHCVIFRMIYRQKCNIIYITTFSEYKDLT